MFNCIVPTITYSERIKFDKETFRYIIVFIEFIYTLDDANILVRYTRFRYYDSGKNIITLR